MRAGRGGRRRRSGKRDVFVLAVKVLLVSWREIGERGVDLCWHRDKRREMGMVE
jgi:hypothetical protein